MLHLIKLPHMVISVKMFPLNLLTKSIFILIYIYGSLFSFMIVWNAKQTNKHFPIKPISISPPIPFYENANHFNYGISMHTEGLFSLFAQRNSYIFVFIDAFSHFVVTHLSPRISSKYAFQTLLHHWITKFGPP